MNADISQRAFGVTVSLLVVSALAGCSSTPVKLDPYGRPYRTKNLMEPQSMRGWCRKADFDTPPALVSGTRPLYPIGQRYKENEGTVVIRFDVSAEGRVVVATGVPNEPEATKWFTSHAIVAMRDWVVTPATKNGAPVSTQCRLCVNYVIRDIRDGQTSCPE